MQLRPEVLGRPVEDVVEVYTTALWLTSGEGPTYPKDTIDYLSGLILAVWYLDGSDDPAIDPAIPCPPQSRGDVERQAEALLGLLRRIGRSSDRESMQVFGAWDMLCYALGWDNRSPIEKATVRYRVA